MEMSYQQAMEQLKSMFENFDEDTIKTVLASNDGHVEKTIDDLVKLTDEVEKVPDDENLFAEPSSNKNRSGGNQYTDFAARNAQEDEDAKMAYELQKQYMQEEQRAGGSRNSYSNANNYGNSNINNDNERVSNSRANVEPHHPSNRFDYGESGNSNAGNQNVVYAHPSHTEKKPNFMKKVKIALQNLFKGKGKIFRKGSKDQGYQEFEKYEPMQERLNPNPVNNYGANDGAQYEEDESPMKLQDVMAEQGVSKGEIRRHDNSEMNDRNDQNDRNDSPVNKQPDFKKENIRKYNDYAASSRQDELISPNHFSYDN